jgi:hypothetical protein
MARIIGIDLGTTNSLVAYVDDKSGLPRVIPDREGRALLPSVVAFTPQGVLVGEAAKRQLLLNLIKLRYGDTPNFVTLSQLVAGYTVEGRLSLGGDFDRRGWAFGDDFDVGVGGTFSDRPTVTYAPLRGPDFAELMLKPIAPNSLFAVILAGSSPRVVFGLGVHAINGLNNWSRRPGGFLPERREFNQVLSLLSSLSDAVLLVVEAGRVRYDLVQRTVESIGADRIFGVVLNKVPEREIVATYGYHYYAPYR